MTPGFIDFPAFILVVLFFFKFSYEFLGLKHFGMQEIVLMSPGWYVSLWEIP